MKKITLFILVFLSIVVSLFVVFERYRLENTGDSVEIVLDFSAFEQLKRVTKLPALELLHELKTFGITSVAIYEKTLDHLLKKNSLVLISGNELAREFYLDGKLDPIFEKLFQSKTDIDNYFLLFTDYQAFSKISRIFSGIEDIVIKGSYEDDERGLYLLEVENGDTPLTGYYIGFDQEEVDLISKAGLKVVPRINDRRERLVVLPDILAEVKQRGEISGIIFAGGTVLGHPEDLSKTAQILKDSGLKVGMIEPFIGYQLGIRELAVLMDFNITRVHSLLQKEMDKYTLEKILDRYIRAVKERNVRTLYYRPFLVEKNKVKPFELNKNLLTQLKRSLNTDGYNLGESKPFTYKNLPSYLIILISIGIFAAVLLLIKYFIRLPDWVDYVFLPLALLATTGGVLKGYVLLSRDLLALLASIIFPSLAIIYGFKEAGKITLKNEEIITRAIVIFLKTTAITMVGVLIVIGLLSDIRYIYQINQFRGIKISFILPLLIVGMYYLKVRSGVKNLSEYLEVLKKVPEYLNQPVRYSHLVIFMILVLAGLVYIGRTGNYPILPVLPLEMKIRDFLEDLLVFRPRFKEFAIGHPFMILALYYTLKKEKRGLTLPLLIIGSIGQITVLNTFSHIHTPILVSLFRVLSAIVLGVVGGLILIIVYNQLVKLWMGLRRWIYE